MTAAASTDSTVIRILQGEALTAALPAVARLRLSIFHEFPYLYDGDLAYETEYLRTYAQAPGAMAALVYDGERVVGAATALPLRSEMPELQQPFLNQTEFDLSDILYIGEVLVESAYHGRGLGHRLLDACEAHAAELGLSTVTFCTVERPADHPLRPQDARDLETFWRKRGYTKRPDLTAYLSWKDRGDLEETPKPMRFWVQRF